MSRTSWSALAVFLSLPYMTTASPNVGPSNDTALLHVSSQLHLAWSTSQAGTNIMQNFMTAPVEPLTYAAGLYQPNTATKKVNVTGLLVLVSVSNAASVAPANIAFMSCESDAYGGNGPLLNATAFFNTVIGQNPAGIVLYSTLSNHCNYTVDGSITSSPAMVFSMVGQNNSTQLQNALKMTGPALGQAIVSNSTAAPTQPMNNSDSGPPAATSQNVLGPSPTTAVAMIILYSITGVITGLFLIIIITGAVRAHRHPERYGPRHGVSGRPRQSRAKGIARAMLETIPIVKFGDGDPAQAPKPPTDVELGGSRSGVSGAQAAGTTTTAEAGAPRTSTAGDKDRVVPVAGEGEEGAAATAPKSTGETAGKAREVDEGAIAAAPAAAATATSTSAKDEATRHEEGLGCSICTEDFVKGEDVRVLPCDHKYHPECIDPWLLNVSGTCPLCRIDLRPDSTSIPPASTTTATTDATATTSPAANESEREAERRRSRSGISVYLEHHLGISIQSRPEERIAALRRLRDTNRSGGRGTPDGDNRKRNRLSGILRERLGGRRSSHVGSTASASVAGNGDESADPTMTTVAGAGATTSASATPPATRGTDAAAAPTSTEPPTRPT